MRRAALNSVPNLGQMRTNKCTHRFVASMICMSKRLGIVPTTTKSLAQRFPGAGSEFGWVIEYRFHLVIGLSL